MYGRYGTDQLNIALLVIYLLLLLINLYTRNIILPMFMWVILVFSLFRSLSRNIYARQRENLFFLKIWRPVKSSLALNLRRLVEIRTNRFRRCTNCKIVLRLPRRTGKHTVRCPRCQHRFSVRVLF
jgi:surface polysaccharide O-acyltransferase-like enzyme